MDKEQILLRYEQAAKYEAYTYQEKSRAAHRAPDAGRRRRKEAESRAALAEMSDSPQDWVPTYAAALDRLHHERQWVIASAGPFYRANLITDVTRLVKGGKEANVYVCSAHPATGLSLAAAKLYRPRMLRQLKNDAIYKAGRQLVDEAGKLMKNRREKVALRKKTRFGQKVDIEWWIGNEYRVQSGLHAAGADVPRPLGFEGTAVLMEFIGDEQTAAPLLNDVSLAPEEVRPLFDRIMANIKLMLDHHHIHGDLSAYNILYWQGRITIIDFPQMVEARHNPHAFNLLERDIRRVGDYFGRYGLAADPVALAIQLWEPYMGEAPR